MKYIRYALTLLLVVLLFTSYTYTSQIWPFSFPNHFKINKEKSFSVVVLPDTQKYSRSYPEIFCSQTKWIVANAENLNIVFVSQLGDIVDDGSDKLEWRAASKCMSNLDGVIPYGIVPGNHDLDIVSNKESGFENYNSFFPASRFSANEWYQGQYDNNQNNYQIINVNRIKLLFLNLEVEPSNQAIEWANSILKNNSDARSIVTTHKYMSDADTYRFTSREFSKNGNTGEDIWNKLITNNCSVLMVWAGHSNSMSGENRLTSENGCGQKVEQIVQDYQDRELGGNGKLRIYIFTPKKKIVEVYTYSPHTEEFERDPNSEFTVPFI